MQLPPFLIGFLNDIGGLAGWLLLAVVIDVIFGVLTALKQGAFEWERLADFLSTYGVKLFAWLALELLALMPADLLAITQVTTVVARGAYAILMLSAVGSILGHVQALGLLGGGEPLARFGVPASDQSDTDDNATW